MRPATDEPEVTDMSASQRTVDASQRTEDYDVVVAGASLAGCAAAISFGRAGLRVALLEKRPDPAAYKRICTHYIQSSAIAPLQRLGLLEPMMGCGAVRSRIRMHSPWGWIEPPLHSRVPSGVNLRRERLDPLIRQMAADTPGVELMLGQTVCELLRDGDAVGGVKARDSHGATTTLRAPLVVGADGRGSQVAELAGVPTKTVKHARFAYGGYFEGPQPAGAPDASLWMLDPDMAAVFPTDSELSFYACMPTSERLADFRKDPAQALISLVSGVPDAPPILESRLVGQVQGKLDMTNVAHTPAAPGLALVGDAALAIDPLWGVGCGWALQSSEWLTDSTIPALRGEEPLKRGLRRYRRRHARRLRGHSAMIYDYTGGRKLNRVEQGLFVAARHDQRLAEIFEAFGTRSIGPARMFASSAPRIALLSARRSLSKRPPGRGSTQARAEVESI
jgi:2-polyprenyl-6-methoxyphenol hydroxylase-like FAD-dependent oxidoreductase